MKFWDASALVPLVSRESQSSRCQRMVRQDPRVIVWALTPIEIQSSLARKRRMGSMSRTELEQSRRILRRLMPAWDEIGLGAKLASRAVRLLDLHDLRAADALQLAAAWTASGEEPSRLPFVALDERLLSAAEREGFPVIEP